LPNPQWGNVGDSRHGSDCLLLFQFQNICMPAREFGHAPVGLPPLAFRGLLCMRQAGQQWQDGQPCCVFIHTPLSFSATAQTLRRVGRKSGPYSVRLVWPTAANNKLTVRLQICHLAHSIAGNGKLSA
jgi:hypothetical protein